MYTELEDGIFYNSSDDKDIRYFENQYYVPNGISYNSYVIKDEKTAVLDTVDKKFKDEWIKNTKKLLGEAKPDYLVVHHMEPDHSASIFEFLKIFPDVTVVANKKAIEMIHQFFPEAGNFNVLEVSNGSELSLGEHSLKFFAAPMVHWPEVLMSYDAYSKTLFSADAFGKFGNNSHKEPWEDEAARYYFAIVGKFGAQVQAILKKLGGLEIKRICSLHGPVLDCDLEKYVGLYSDWSSYKTEDNHIIIAYSSVYGNTEKAVKYFEKCLDDAGKSYKTFDVTKHEPSEVIYECFINRKIIFATTTYNGGIFPAMQDLIYRLCERNFQNHEVYIIENGTWAPMAAKVIKGMLEKSKNVKISENIITIKSAMSEENKKQIKELAENI